MGILDRLFGPPNVEKLKARKDVEGLIKALKDKDEDVQWGAAEALGEIKDARAVEPLIEALKDKGGTVRLTAAEALGKIGDTRAVKPLTVILKKKSVWSVRAAIEALGEIGDPSAVEPLIALLKKDVLTYKEDGELVREDTIEALGKIGDPRAVKPLAVLLKEEDHVVRQCAAMAQGKIGEPAVEPLIGALKDDNRNVRQCAVEALGETGSDAAVPALIKVLNDARVHIDVRISACKALGMLESKMSAETVKLLKQKGKELYIKEEDIAKEADTLIMLLVAAHQWGESHGFPLFEKYPLYKNIRSIGERIYRKWGFEAMQKVFDIVTTREWLVGRNLDRFWDGIGPWMA